MLEEKRRQYNKANNYKYARVRQEHLGEVIESLVPKKEHEYVLLLPLIVLVLKTLEEKVGELKGYLVTISARAPKAIKLRPSEINELIRKLNNLLISSITKEDFNRAIKRLESTVQAA